MKKSTTRRYFLKRAFTGTAVFALGNLFPWAVEDVFPWSDYSKFRMTQVIYEGGNWNPRPTAIRRLMWELIKRTSVQGEIKNISIKIDNPELFYHPFLTGTYPVALPGNPCLYPIAW